MKNHSARTKAGDRLTLECSCEAEVIVPVIIMLPRNHVVRIVARGTKCRGLRHARGRRVVVRSERNGGLRTFVARYTAIVTASLLMSS